MEKMSSVAVDELYLIAAESYAQTGDVTKSMKMAQCSSENHRWKLKHFTILLFANSKRKALQHYLGKKRQKEPLFRGIRWADLKKIQPLLILP